MLLDRSTKTTVPQTPLAEPRIDRVSQPVRAAPWLTVKEAALIVGCHERQMWRYLDKARNGMLRLRVREDGVGNRQILQLDPEDVELLRIKFQTHEFLRGPKVRPRSEKTDRRRRSEWRGRAGGGHGC
jgi:hypothetical protein